MSDSAYSIESTDVPEHQLMQRGVGSTIALAGILPKLGLSAFGGSLISFMSGNGFRFAGIAKGFGIASIGSSLVSNGVRVFGGAVTTDRSLAGDGIAGLTGDVVGLSAAGLALAAIAVVAAPVEIPVAVIGLGIAATVGATSGHLLRDANPAFRHFTDDIVGHDLIIAHTPQCIKGPGAKAYDHVFKVGSDIKKISFKYRHTCINSAWMQPIPSEILCTPSWVGMGQQNQNQQRRLPSSALTRDIRFTHAVIQPSGKRRISEKLLSG